MVQEALLDPSSANCSMDVSRYICDACGATFGSASAAVEHGHSEGVSHRFVEAVCPAPGDHVYTAQYKNLFATGARAGDGAEEDDEGVATATLAEAGQLVASFVSLPEHHGVYIGGGKVMHFDGCSRGVFLAGDAQVSLASVDDFCRGSRMLLRLHGSPLPRAEAVERAFWALGKRGYHCQTFNCEHFATWCVTGTASSSQAWFSSLYVDPVFPLGWVTAAAKDAVHNASDLLAVNDYACSCGRAAAARPGGSGASASGAGASATAATARTGGARGGALCGAGHLTCLACLAARRATVSAAAARRCGEAAGGDEAGPRRPLCCARPACWAELPPPEARETWRRAPRSARWSVVAPAPDRRPPDVPPPPAPFAADPAAPWRRQAWSARRRQQPASGAAK